MGNESYGMEDETMNVRNLLTLNAALTVLVSITALLSPDTFLNLNGLEVSQTSVNLER